MKALSIRREKFAANLAAGLSATAAYIKAGYSKNGAGQSAGKLLKNTEVQARVRELSEKATEATLHRCPSCSATFEIRWRAGLDEDLVESETSISPASSLLVTAAAGVPQGAESFPLSTLPPLADEKGRKANLCIVP